MTAGKNESTVDVAVEVEGGEYKNTSTGKKQVSSVHDLRLFEMGRWWVSGRRRRTARLMG